MNAANATLFDEKLNTDKEYWLEKLSGDLSVSGLPLDFKRPAAFLDERATLAGEVQQEVVDKLLSVCGHAETLVFTALVTALNVCLYKYTGNEDIIIGTTIHERHREV